MEREIEISRPQENPKSFCAAPPDEKLNGCGKLTREIVLPGYRD
jgi:hypothetical protein